MGKKQETKETVTEIPLAEIRDFPDHPYQVKDDDSMRVLMKALKNEA